MTKPNVDEVLYQDYKNSAQNHTQKLEAFWNSFWRRLKLPNPMDYIGGNPKESDMGFYDRLLVMVLKTGILYKENR